MNTVRSKLYQINGQSEYLAISRMKTVILTIAIKKLTIAAMKIADHTISSGEALNVMSRLTPSAISAGILSK